jgi:hypothetical protein
VPEQVEFPRNLFTPFFSRLGPTHRRHPSRSVQGANRRETLSSRSTAYDARANIATAIVGLSTHLAHVSPHKTRKQPLGAAIGPWCAVDGVRQSNWLSAFFLVDLRHRGARPDRRVLLIDQLQGEHTCMCIPTLKLQQCSSTPFPPLRCLFARCRRVSRCAALTVIGAHGCIAYASFPFM